MAGQYVLSIMVAATLASGLAAEQGRDSTGHLVSTNANVCKHGLYAQPNGGRFAVMLFCDDAAGSHLAVICYAPGCESSTEKPGPWELGKRFWQEGDWTRNVTGFAWDLTGECLYVSTGGTYGTGDVFVLNLQRGQYARLPIPLEGSVLPRGTYGTRLIQLDAARKLLTFEVEYYDARQEKPVTESKTVPLTGSGCAGDRREQPL